jgi:mono/diheme cytochrome c family protein
MKTSWIVAFALVVGACHATVRADDAPRASSSQVRRIELPHYQSNLPDGPGREAFAVACLACHSSSYITMQPPQSAAKWEEAVRKMVKVYAAPITEDQVGPVAQYIAAVKEAGQGDLTESLVPRPAQKQRVVKVATDEATRAADAKRGETLFAANCASCHGPRGAGDGLAAKTQLPPPTDLTSHHYGTDALCAAITRGVPATAMPGYPDLSDDDLRALVTFTQQLASPDAKSNARPAPDSAKTLYAQNCQGCHGSSGAGDGAFAPTAPRPPASFRDVRPSRERALHAIAEGVPATTMLSWKSKLNETQRAELADYVRSLFTEPSEK